MTRSTWTAAIFCAALTAAATCSRPSDLPADLDGRVTSASARQAGAVLFRQHCALCHGELGNGHGERASSFAAPPRDFTNAAWRRSTSPARVFRAIRDGVRGTPMASWRVLGDEQLIDLTARVLSFGDDR
jgi:mono/diheme cytochrome c family protein